MKKYLLMLPLAALLFAACKKDNGTDSLKFENDVLEFSAEGGVKTVKLLTNTQWTIKTNGEEWFNVTPASGKGDTELTITVESYTDAALRTARITAEGGSLMTTLNILQDRPAVPGQPEERTYKVRAYEQDYTIDAPQKYTYKVELGEGEGMSLVSNDESHIVLHFTANESREFREFTLKITTTDGEAIENVHLSQSWRTIEPGELLFEEIFFTGMKLPDSNSSDSSAGDQYFKLTNNTDETLYADGVLIAISETDSQVTSTGAYWAYPDLPDSIGINTLYSIPGEGKDVPIEPGKSIVLAIDAQNFEEANGAGCDLSKADFEFYDYTGNDDYPDTDNPEVKNLQNWFKSSWTFTSLHDRGYESYAIAVAPHGMKANTYMKEFPWNGQRVMDFNGYHFKQDIEDAYLIPNDWILDAVNCAVVENLGTLAFNAKVDAGFTNVTTIDRDPERYGKSVVRKRDAEGKLIDTNNSSNDFEISDVPTMK